MWIHAGITRRGLEYWIGGLQIHMMRLKRIFRTTPFVRFLLAMIPVLVVDAVLIPISIFAGAPTLRGVLTVNFLAVAILGLRFTLLFFSRLRCRFCRKAFGRDTHKDSGGFPVVQCPRCLNQWIL